MTTAKKKNDRLGPSQRKILALLEERRSAPDKDNRAMTTVDIGRVCFKGDTHKARCCLMRMHKADLVMQTAVRRGVVAKWSLPVNVETPQEPSGRTEVLPEAGGGTAAALEASRASQEPSHEPSLHERARRFFSKHEGRVTGMALHAHFSSEQIDTLSGQGVIKPSGMDDTYLWNDTSAKLPHESRPGTTPSL